MHDLVILDPHVEVGQNLARFRWLNRLLRDGPDKIKNVICVGDYASMESLSTHEKPGSKADRSRPSLSAEFAASRESQDILFDGCGHIPKTHRYMIKGNHEHRFDRWAEANPALADSIDFDGDSGFTENWGTIRRYGEWQTVRGVDYTHVPFNAMGQPISGIWRTRTVALQSPRSVIFGHSHNMQFSSVAFFGSDNHSRCALSGPAFQDGDKMPNYAKNLQTGWSYGVLLVLPLGENNGFSFKWISMQELKYIYG